MNHDKYEHGNLYLKKVSKVTLDIMFYLQARDGCTDHRNQLFKSETRGGKKTQITTRFKSGNTSKLFL